MVNRKRKVLLLTTLISVFTMATVASIFSSQTRSYSGSASGETNLYSITLTKDKATSYSSKANSTYSSHYDNTLNFKTARGNGMTVLVSNSTSDVNGDYGYLGSIYSESNLVVESEYATGGKSFQKVNSITITSASSFAKTAELHFNGSDSYETLSIPAKSSATFDTSTLDYNVRSFSISCSHGEYSPISITSIVINYSCSSDYTEDAVLSSIAVDASGAKTQYTVGESFSSSGIVVTATYSDLSEVVVSPTSIASPDMSSAGEKNVTVSYTEGGITKTTSYQITVEEAPSGLSGTYSGTYTTLEFTSNTEGTYIYGSEKLYFTYQISGSAITFTYKSGSNADFGTYKLFSGSTTVNTTGLIISSTQISVKTYNIFDSATTRTFTK